MDEDQRMADIIQTHCERVNQIVESVMQISRREPPKPEYLLLASWLTEFTDSDVVSLICPRPLLIQTGKQDRIAHWPQVVEEFEASQAHYHKLGLGDRIEMDLHEAGHEPRVQSGVRFLSRWLMDGR